MDEKLISVAMQIVLHAGDARTKGSESIDAALQDDFEKADCLMKEANECLKEAHRAQTEIIQDECRGEKVEISLLFIHAQDTLMTIATELNNYKKMIKMYKKLREELDQCKK